MTVTEESQQKDNILSPSADVASKEALPSAGGVASEVSPGDGALSPPDTKVENNDVKGGGEGDEDVGFGPPPAFPNSSKLGKRKRTIMAVSETAAADGGGASLEDETSSEDGEGGISKKANKNSQSIHRGIKEEVKSPVDEEGARKYSDAMLLASLSDVEGTPKKKETEFADGNTTTATTSKVPQVSGGGSPPSSNAPTPLRSNVHAPRPGEPIKPFALLPKQGPGLSASASKSPGARDPKNEKGGAMYNPYPPQHGYHPSYGYPPTPGGYGYPYYGYPPGPSSYHPYYPPPSHPSAAAGPPSTEGPASPEKWGPYYSPKHQERKTTPAAKGPEKVHSTTAPFHPLSTSSSKISEEGDTTGAVAEGMYGPPPPYQHMYDPRYGPPPAYKNTGPPAGVSRDDGSPPRSSSSNRGPPPSVHTPPRSAPYYDPAAYAPPQSGPDSPPRSSYPPSSYPGAPPSDPYEQYAYDPTTTSPSASGDAHYHVPASVSNETDHSPNSSKYHQFRKGGRSIHSVPIILRKKFSWRNYPELEEYLIANRTDYLRHSALNYTAEQKHFNNRLTEGLLELAAKLNYVFDETCFNFVAVRDRVRCYYKSYVQSSKKRGVVVGFSRQEDGGLVEKEKIMKC